jgi:hypothetical protein
MAQMAFVEHHDMIEALPADRADQPFGVGVLPGSTRRRRAVSNTDGSNPAYEYLDVGAIAVPDQVTRGLLPAASLSELIGDPFGRWVRGDPKPQDLPPAMAHNQQTVEQTKGDRRHDEQVDGDNAISMVAKERLPPLRRRSPPPRQCRCRT